MRELAGYDPQRALEVVRWPMLEALLAYRAQLRAHALEDWRYRNLVFTIGSLFSKRRQRPPPIPRILRGDDDATDA